MYFLIALFLVCITSLNGFRHQARLSSSLNKALSAIQVGSTSDIPNGERLVVETPVGTVVVANVDGSFYAVILLI